MKNPYTEEQRKWLSGLQEHYRLVTNGTCMAGIRVGGEASSDPCEGSIGYRHAIARRHLKLIADAANKIRANKEIGSFEAWSEQYDDLQPVPISRFSAGKWSCQKHDERFPRIDAERIDLSNSENLFKVVYRVVLRQSHLFLARWNAHFMGTATEEGWKLFKKTAFQSPMSDDEAVKFETEWRNEAHAVVWKMRDLERRLANKEWDSLEYRALLLKSEPAVAGWGCRKIRLDLSGLHPDDSRNSWEGHWELGYMIVIPQQDGHAIITACESDSRFRLPEISGIHKDIPVRTNPNEPYQAHEPLKREISRRVWELDEIGMRESLYQSWSTEEQDEAQAWIKIRGTHRSTHQGQAPNNLPMFF